MKTVVIDTSALSDLFFATQKPHMTAVAKAKSQSVKTMATLVMALRRDAGTFVDYLGDSVAETESNILVSWLVDDYLERVASDSN